MNRARDTLLCGVYSLKFGRIYSLWGLILHPSTGLVKFRCNVSPLRGEKSHNRHLSNLNTVCPEGNPAGKNCVLSNDDNYHGKPAKNQAIALDVQCRQHSLLGTQACVPKDIFRLVRHAPKRA